MERSRTRAYRTGLLVLLAAAYAAGCRPGTPIREAVHLDEQLVSPGRRVRAGDRLGTVGNTGNAQGTAPHLHFGIYSRGEGPLDPLPFVHEPRTTPSPVTADDDPLGTWRRTANAGFRLRAGSGTSAPILMELPRHTVLRLEAAIADWYRVALPEGTRGFVIARATQPLESPIRRHQPPASTLVRQRPATPIAAGCRSTDHPKPPLP
jgi:hypothetical protein